MGSLKGKIDYMKKTRLIIHANMNLWKRCVNETVLHAKFLYLICKHTRISNAFISKAKQHYKQHFIIEAKQHLQVKFLTGRE